MHVPAPEFPPPAEPALGTDTLSGSPLTAPQPGMQRPAGAASQAGATSPPSTSRQGEIAPAGDGVTWLNSLPLSMAMLRGKVVMIDFWEPTCINCIRTYPINKKWWERYRKDGFEIIGVEDPEFDIARSLAHVRAAVKRFELPYPILVDAHLQVWNSYKSNSWPNRFLIDAKGYIRYHVAGEGDDAEFERAIQMLLQEAHPELTFPASYGIASDQNVLAPACGGAPTPEMYVGDWFGRGVLANPEGYRDGMTIDYHPPGAVEDGRFVLSGRWETDRNGMIYRGTHKGNEPGDDHVALRYHARELYAVMNVSHGHPSRLYIMQDGKFLTTANKGVDVQIDSHQRSYIEVREPRMYYVVQNPQFGSHTLDLFPTRSGFTLNSFTFGNNCQTQFDHS
jgi:thiol-disulfide isomerase/thioredoxin